jgi:pimeloyl-ACP methyl ester carboxylesterase
MNLWSQLVDAITRPPRDTYAEDSLVGGPDGSFRFALPGYPVRCFVREDVQLVNARGQTLRCSHFRPSIDQQPHERHSDGLGISGRSGDRANESLGGMQESYPGAVEGLSRHPPRRPAVIYLHSNSGSRRDAEEILFNTLQYDMSVFALDFAGSGNSDGEFVTLGAHEVLDVETVVEHLRSRDDVSTIGLWGRSMGAVTAILYAHRDPSIGAIVVDSPFSDLMRLMTEIATDDQAGMGLPKPLVKMLLAFMKRSVRRRAGFNLEDVSPVKVVARRTSRPSLATASRIRS